MLLELPPPCAPTGPLRGAQANGRTSPTERGSAEQIAAIWAEHHKLFKNMMDEPMFQTIELCSICLETADKAKKSVKTRRNNRQIILANAHGFLVYCIARSGFRYLLTRASLW
ncbi:hypothetical protein BD779DRAFT_1550143 [Infundibulicybe gibba]|nr:hypothetical protein BD779DRAFT_1550143 [Infundibulicybe gibba]